MTKGKNIKPPISDHIKHGINTFFPFIKIPFLPKTDHHELFSTDIDITIKKTKPSDGNMTNWELFIISYLVKSINPNSIFEIGTFDGRTTLNIASNSRDTAKVFTLDLPESELGSITFNTEETENKYIQKEESGTRFKDTPYSSKITQLLGDSAQVDLSDHFKSMDFIFIDGSHAYDYVISDTKLALDLLTPNGGTILWHDYDTSCWPGVTKALHEFYLKDDRFHSLKHIQGTTFAYLEL